MSKYNHNNMRKIETIWHHILLSALADKKFQHTQQEIARMFGYSLSTVNHALGTISEIGAVRKEARFFVLENFQKLLYFWASMRNLSRDIVYRGYYTGSVAEIEGLVPSGVIYAAYSAAKKILGEAPADYSTVYCYADKEVQTEFGLRFPSLKEKQIPNLIVLKVPAVMKKYGKITTLPQTFVDVWNLKDWYSPDFVAALEGKINAVLS
ncbi:MAG: Uncharacterized protein FD145_966 [Candidatus Saganbacteria bacterium]|uniref:HTH iclR-type domain-containing protein n=1 Tax=Candidatus Saganbacteria bacterium TaxID=2575572 RepID=A0A833L0U0_UNCSA|nr:MAG: Uncharacterized protein FD145_966 [Candidatus Saganbacteria bacterium]